MSVKKLENGCIWGKEVYIMRSKPKKPINPAHKIGTWCGYNIILTEDRFGKIAKGTIDKLKKEGYQIVSLEQTSESINYTKFKPKFPLALIIGNEGKGVKKSLLKRSDKIINIPMRGQKESLNVSVALGIAAYWIGGFR